MVLSALALWLHRAKLIKQSKFVWIMVLLRDAVALRYDQVAQNTLFRKEGRRELKIEV
jgi:hypothetical protein